MNERRKAERHPVHISLSICDLYQQNQDGISGLDTPIAVENLSRGGLCFVSEGIFPLNYYFNAALNLDENTKPIFTIVKIIRSEIAERDLYRYGCEFTNLPEDYANLLDTYSV